MVAGGGAGGGGWGMERVWGMECGGGSRPSLPKAGLARLVWPLPYPDSHLTAQIRPRS